MFLFLYFHSSLRTRENCFLLTLTSQQLRFLNRKKRCQFAFQKAAHILRGKAAVPDPDLIFVLSPQTSSPLAASQFTAWTHPLSLAWAPAIRGKFLNFNHYFYVKISELCPVKFFIWSITCWIRSILWCLGTVRILHSCHESLRAGFRRAGAFKAWCWRVHSYWKINAARLDTGSLAWSSIDDYSQKS